MLENKMSNSDLNDLNDLNRTRQNQSNLVKQSPQRVSSKRTEAAGKSSIKQLQLRNFHRVKRKQMATHAAEDIDFQSEHNENVNEASILYEQKPDALFNVLPHKRSDQP